MYLRYLLRFTVGVTAVVEESGVASLECGVDELVGVEGHEVVVLQPLLGVLPGAAHKLLVVQQLTHVLHHKSAPGKPSHGYIFRH